MLEYMPNEIIEATDIYSGETVMATPHLCYFVVLSPVNMMQKIAASAPAYFGFSLSDMDDEQRRELDDYLRSYEQKMLVFEHSDDLWMLLPVLYQSSSLCVALVFDGKIIDRSEILRLAGMKECSDVFVFSKYITITAAMVTPELAAKKKSFFKFCDILRLCFFNMNRLSGYNDEEIVKKKIISQVFRLSVLVGCPLDSLIFEGGDKSGASGTDFSLLSAFLMTFMMVARSSSLKRTACILLKPSKSAVVAEINFGYSDTIELCDAVLEWERLCMDKNMLFEYYSQDGRAHVTFHPLRRDWSYLGLKQEITFI